MLIELIPVVWLVAGVRHMCMRGEGVGAASGRVICSGWLLWSGEAGNVASSPLKHV